MSCHLCYCYSKDYKLDWYSFILGKFFFCQNFTEVFNSTSLNLPPLLLYIVIFQDSIMAEKTYSLIKAREIYFSNDVAKTCSYELEISRNTEINHLFQFKHFFHVIDIFQNLRLQFYSLAADVWTH